MRFRATVTEITTFAHIVQAISKLSKKCILKFTPDLFHLILDDGCSDGGNDVQVWSQVPNASLFTSYRIESNHQNTIHLSTSTTALLSVLRSAEAHQSQGSSKGGNRSKGEKGEGGEIVVKLAKRPVAGTGGAEGGAVVMKPVLVWEIGGSVEHNIPPPLSHELHIKVLRLEDVEKLREPLCPTPDVHIVLPPLSTLRTVVDHLSRLSASSYITVSANLQGILRFEAGGEAGGGNGDGEGGGGGDSGGVEVMTEWKGLINPTITNAEDSQNSTLISTAQAHPEMFHTSAIAIKSLVRFLSAHCVQGSTIAALCAGHSLIMYLYLGDVNSPGGCLTFFLPAVDTG